VAGKTARSRLFIAITVSLLINITVLGFMFWRERVMTHMRREREVTVFLPKLDLAPHQRRPPPPPPELPPPPAEPLRPAADGAPTTAPRAVTSPPSAVTQTGPQLVAEPGVEAALPGLKLGCSGRTERSLNPGERHDCWQAQVKIDPPKSGVLSSPQQEREKYAVLAPQAPVSGPPFPGIQFSVGALTPGQLPSERYEVSIGLGGISVSYPADDKHFLPFQGSSVKHVFKPDEIYAVPKPR
jgi:hypothetical protein